MLNIKETENKADDYDDDDDAQITIFNLMLLKSFYFGIEFTVIL